PKIPISVNPSFTSSSLNGLMTASIFFIGERLHSHELGPQSRPVPPSLLRLALRVGPFFVLAEVQPDPLLFLADSQPHGPIHDLQEHSRPHECKYPGDPNCDHLDSKLAGVAKK